jgi:hypothetical protein
MSEIHEEVEALIEAIEPQLQNSLGLITQEDWSDNPEKDMVLKIQFPLTERNLKYAFDLQNMSIKHSCNENERVVTLISKLLEFYKIFKDRYFIYNDNAQRVFDYQEEKNKRKKSGGLEAEIKFQSDLTEHFQKLTVLFKKINNLVSDDRVVIPTFNDEPIPLIMAPLFEENYPQIKTFLEKREEKENAKANGTTKGESTHSS